MKEIVLAALCALAVTGIASSAAAGWDDSYTECCGIHPPRYYYFSGPSYFANGRYRGRFWYRAYHRGDVTRRRGRALRYR